MSSLSGEPSLTTVAKKVALVTLSSFATTKAAGGAASSSSPPHRIGTAVTGGPAVIADGTSASGKSRKSASRGGGKATIRITLPLSGGEDPARNDATQPDVQREAIFNYKTELARMKKKFKHKNGVDNGDHKNGVDPFISDEDDDVRRIAQQFEAKYGSTVSTNKKKRRGRKDDYADIGMGYDESDSFIDNTDGYDEIIPQNVSAIHGGFYINSGALEFKANEHVVISESSSSSEEDDDDEDGDENDSDDDSSKDGLKKNRKRILDEDSCASDAYRKPGTPPLLKKQKIGNGMPKMKKTFLTPDKIKVKKRHTQITSIPNDHSAAKIAKLSDSVELKETIHAETLALSVIPQIIHLEQGRNVQENVKDANLASCNHKPTVDSITDVINYVAKGKHDSLVTASLPITNNPHQHVFHHFYHHPQLPQHAITNDISSITSISPQIFGNSYAAASLDDKIRLNTFTDISIADGGVAAPVSALSEQKAGEPSRKSPTNLEPDAAPSEPIVLPPNIQVDILQIVEEIKNALVANVDANIPVFSSHVNSLVLSFERSSKCLGRQSRYKVYQYLAYFAKCKREAMLRRVKKLVRGEEESNLVKQIISLKAQIAVVMPPALEAYEQNCARVTQLKQVESDENKGIRMPKKLFPWNEELRKTVRDIFSIKRKLLVSQSVDKDALDPQLEVFVKTDVHPAFPEGWVTLAACLKTARNEKRQIVANKDSKVAGIVSVNAVKHLESVQQTSVNIPKIDVGLSRLSVPTMKEPVVTLATNSTTENLVNVLKAGKSVNTGSVTINAVKPTEQPAPINLSPTVSLIPKSCEPDKSKPSPVLSNSKEHDRKLTAATILRREPSSKSDLCDVIDLTSPFSEQKQRKSIAKPKHKMPPEVITSELTITPTSNGVCGAPKSDATDIQQVMDDLNALQQMAAPTKSTTLDPASAVSVIAQSKVYPPIVQSTAQMGDNLSAYQRQYLSAITSAVSSVKPAHRQDLNATSVPYLHSKSSPSQNNIDAASSAKIRHSHPAMQPQSINIMDDMLANFLTECGYPKTGQKPSKAAPPSQK